MSVLIRRAAYIVRDAGRIERDADLLIEGDRIVALGVGLTPPDGAEQLDARGCAVIPGLVNAHTHLYQSFLKGLRDDVGLVDWCEATLFPLNYAVHVAQWEDGDETSAYHWVSLSALEMIRGGVTCCIDMQRNMDRGFEAWLEIGMRGVGAITLSDRWTPAVLRREPEIARREWLRQAAAWHGVHPTVDTVLAPSTPFNCSRDLLLWARDHAAELGIGIMIHLAETRYEVASVTEETGLTPVAYAHSLGLLGPRTSAVHCVHVTPGELDLLAESGATVVHCPKSNLKLGSGVAPAPAMLARGIPVALAADGAASNDTLDMFEETRLAAMLHKGIAEDPTIITARQAFRMATEGGARAAGIEAGVLDPGKLADLAIIDLDRSHLQPLHDVVNTLVYCAKSSDVETTIIGGRVVMRRGEILTVDEAVVRHAAAEYGARLYERGLAQWQAFRNEN